MVVDWDTALMCSLLKQQKKLNNWMWELITFHIHVDLFCDWFFFLCLPQFASGSTAPKTDHLSEKKAAPPFSSSPSIQLKHKLTSCFQDLFTP